MHTPITVSVTVPVPSAVAFEIFTNPTYIMQWNAASPEWCCPLAIQDLRVGGSFTSRMEARDGSEGFDFTGTYTLVEPGVALGYTMADGRTVSVRFAEVAGVTTVTEVFDPESEHSPELQQAGWQSILDAYAQCVVAKL